MEELLLDIKLANYYQDFNDFEEQLVKSVRELLGHSSITVTEIYTQFPQDYLAQVFTEKQINQAYNSQKVTA